MRSVWRDAAHARRARRSSTSGSTTPPRSRARCTAHADGSTARDVDAGGQRARSRCTCPARHIARNALAATAAALAAGRAAADDRAGLEAFRAGRRSPGRALRGIGGATVIDDTYNANPDSVRAAIDVLASRPAPRWLVLGDMGEVGDAGSGVPPRDRRLRARPRHRAPGRLRQRLPPTRCARSAPAPNCIASVDGIAAADGCRHREHRSSCRPASQTSSRGQADVQACHGAGQGLALHADGTRRRRADAARRPGSATDAAVALPNCWRSEIRDVQRLRLPHAARGAGDA